MFFTLRYRLAALMLVMLAFTVACKKNNNSSSANLKLINAIPNSGAIDARVNDQLFAGSISYGAASFYQQVGTSFNFKVNATGSGTAFNSTYTLVNGKSYSVYVYDSLSKIKASLIEDDKTVPPSGKAYVRFLHLLTDGVAVDVLKSGGPTKLFSNRSFQDHQTNSSVVAYTAIDPGPFSCSAVIAGTTTSVAQLGSFDATAGKTYTLVLRGFNKATSFTTESPKLVPIEDQ
ncbi:MAG: DUF4397 domain-containing protein [Flavihumibacter sp.]|nr:DUF4397 domain-containing protein [Flavihumibacter sp.]